MKLIELFESTDHVDFISDKQSEREMERLRQLDLTQEAKKRKKKSKGFYSGAWNKAEKHTRHDPPKTQNKGVSARAGFVG